MGKGKGKTWEDQVLAAIKQISTWKHNFNNVGVQTYNPKQKASLKAKRPADFITCYKGRSVLIEAKDVHAGRINFSALKVHQAQHLHRHTQAGGLSLVAIRHVDGNKSRAYLCHYADFAHLARYLSRKSINLKEENSALVEIFRADFPNYGRAWDLAPALEKLKKVDPAPLHRFSPVQVSRGLDDL